MRIRRTEGYEQGLPFQVVLSTAMEAMNMSDLLLRGELVDADVKFNDWNDSIANELEIKIKLRRKK